MLLKSTLHIIFIQPSRVRKDKTDVQSVVELLQISWTNHFQNNPCDIINLSAGTTEEVDTRMLLYAKHAAE